MLGSALGSLQSSVQDFQANAGARLDTMPTQVQGLSDTLEEIRSRMGKLNQQLVDLQNTVQSLDAKISSGGAAAAGAIPAGGGTTAAPTSATAAMPAASAAPSADTLYSNGLRDITSGE